MVDLHKSVTALSSRLAVKEDEIETTSEELKTITEIVKSDIGDQAVAIEQLIEVTTMLESKALGVSMAHDIQMHFLLMPPCS